MKKILMKSRNQIAEIGKIDPNGFLRVKLRLGSLGVLEYGKDEIDNDISDMQKFNGKETFNVLRDETSIFQPESMQSLEGIPILAYVHEWVLPENSIEPDSIKAPDISYTTPQRSQVGQVAGIAMREGNYLVGNALITDQDVIKQIRKRDLIEISPAYINELFDMQGKWNGQSYDLVQGPAYYNHILLLPFDQARAGRDLKILNRKNKKGDKMEPEKKIGVSTPEGVIFVLPESQSALEKFVQTNQKTTDKLAKTTDRVADLDNTIEEVKKLKEENAKLKEENEKQKGEAEAVKAELETATSPEAIESMVEEMVETDAVIEAIGEPALQADTKGNRAADKKRKVVKYYLEKQGRKVDDKELTDGYVKGAWNIVSDSMLESKKQTKSNVPVATVFDTKTQKTARTPAQILGYDKNTKKEA